MAPEPRDPLTDILALVRPEAVVAAELRCRGAFHLTFEGHPGVKFGVVVEGECLMALRGRAPTRLRAGDVFLLGGQPAFSVASDLKAPPRDANLLLRSTAGRIAEIGRGCSSTRFARAITAGHARSTSSRSSSSRTRSAGSTPMGGAQRGEVGCARSGPRASRPRSDIST